MLGTGYRLSLAVHVRFIEIDVSLVASGPHAWEKHLPFRRIFQFPGPVSMNIFAIERRPVFRRDDLVRGIEILPVDYRVRTVLFSSEIADESERIVRLVLVRRSLCLRPYDHYGEDREPYDYHGEAQKKRIGHRRFPFHGVEQAPETCRQKRYHEEGRTCVERQTEHIHEEKIRVGRQFRQIRYDAEQDDSQNDSRYHEYLHIFPERIVSVLTFPVIEHEHQRRNGQQIQKMHADGKPHQERNQHYPPVRIRSVSLLVPFRHRPEHHRGKKRRHRIDFALDCRKPESVGEAICQCAYYPGAVNGNGAGHRPGTVSVRLHRPLRQEDYGKIKEKYGQCRTDRTHHIHRHRSMHVVREHGKEPRDQLEYRVSRRMPHLKFI